MEKERFPFAAGRSRTYPHKPDSFLPCLVRTSRNNMIFTIEDDGVGIDDMSRLENGYGVRNVIERIKLNYGEKYGVTFESSPGNGTKVTIVVPVR